MEGGPAGPKRRTQISVCRAIGNRYQPGDQQSKPRLV